MADISVAFDRDGTFCDVIAQVKGQEPTVFKLLSEEPANYPDAPTEAIRRILEKVEGKSIPVGEKLDGSRIASCRIGTTVATNAPLQHKGERFAFVTTGGLGDVCLIGNQSRPELFNLKFHKPRPLHSTVIEVEEYIIPEDHDLNPTPRNRDDLAAESRSSPDKLVRTLSGEYIRVIQKLSPLAVRSQLEALRAEGYSSVAICPMHAYLYPAHEDLVAEIAREVGFEYITTSARTSPTIKFLK